MKRVLDVVISAIALVVLAPVLAILAGLIWFKLGWPVLFRQQRPGLHGKPFEMIKFRTMTEARGPDGRLLPDAERLTPLGRFLRSTSLDELPELWNVLKGDMSLVGPRPLLTKYLPLYSAEQARRHEVRPGITGWAQVNGRNALSWEERLKLDTWYVDHQTIWLDLKILFLTVLKVLRREGISAQGHATMHEFTGSADPQGKRSHNKLAIIGAGGHGKVVADAAQLAGWQTIHFFDDKANPNWSKSEWPIIGAVQDLLSDPTDYDGAIVAIGNNQVRLRIARTLEAAKIKLVTICHPSAVVSEYAEIGPGSVICAGAQINIYARLGMAVIVNTGASVDHDCELGDGVHICPGAHLAGGVKVGDGAWIGIGACVKEYLTIGANVTVAAGAVVVTDIADKKTVAGIPARELAH